MGIDASQVVDIFVICVKVIINIINKKATMSLSANGWEISLRGIGYAEY